MIPARGRGRERASTRTQPLAFYETIRGWFDFHDIYDQAVAEAQDGAVFVEIGSWLGRSTAYLGEAIKTSGKRIHLTAVDNWYGSAGTEEGAFVWERVLVDQNPFGVFTENMRQGGLQNIVHAMRADSALAAAEFADHSVDFAFIDASHDYEFVYADIVAWLPKVKHGGVLAGHDYTEQFPGVSRAVHQVFGDKVVRRDKSWWVRVE